MALFEAENWAIPGTNSMRLRKNQDLAWMGFCLLLIDLSLIGKRVFRGKFALRIYLEVVPTVLLSLLVVSGNRKWITWLLLSLLKTESGIGGSLFWIGVEIRPCVV